MIIPRKITTGFQRFITPFRLAVNSLKYGRVQEISQCNTDKEEMRGPTEGNREVLAIIKHLLARGDSAFLVLIIIVIIIITTVTVGYSGI